MMTVDLQVNGFGGVDFNSEGLEAEGLRRACEAARAGGCGRFLATFITDSPKAMCRRMERLVRLREGDPLAREMIAGLHVEGPFLNAAPGYIGAHPAAEARAADPDLMERLLEAGGGLVRLVTLAPERDPGGRVTRLLVSRGVAVAAGHCDPGREELAEAIDAGLSVFTHLGNGCPMELPRHDNIIQRALSLRRRLWICFVADGVHVPDFALRNYIDLAGVERCVAVTDAISAAGLGPGRHRLGSWDLEIGEDLIAWGPDRRHLVGSTATMERVREVLARIGLSRAEVDALTVDHPAAVLEGRPPPA